MSSEMNVSNESEASSITMATKPVKAGKKNETKSQPSSWHVNQLKITLWILLNAKRTMIERIDTKCTVTAEDPLGGKFDDTVLRLQLPDGGEQTLYIQAKHKRDTAYRIKSSDLVSTKDTAFSLPKYFECFCAFHRKGTTDDAKFAMCTKEEMFFI